jgi:hypothetical protein
LPAKNLITTAGNGTATDSESPGQAQLTLPDAVIFQSDKSSLTANAKAILRSVAQQVKARARGTVVITDNTDATLDSIPLSRARARAVAAVLTPLTSGVNYSSHGRGSQTPDTPDTITIAFAATTSAEPNPPATGSGAADSLARTGSVTFDGFSDGNATYRASKAAAYRDENLLVLTMTVQCIDGGSEHTCDPDPDLAGSPDVPPQKESSAPSNTWNQIAGTISGFYLLDPATHTEYIALRRTDAVPVTATLTNSVGAGATYRVWSYFPAPPSGTNSVILLSPGGSARLGPIPVSPAPPATR